MDIDDNFKPYMETFTKYNTTSPNHPERKKRDEEYEQKRRMMIISSLKNEGLTPDTTLSTEELRSQLQEVIDKKSKGTDGSVKIKTDSVYGEMLNPESTEEESVEETEIEEESNSDTTELNTDTELTGVPMTADKLTNIIDTVESSPVLDELDKMAEEMGGTLIPKEIEVYKDTYGRYYIPNSEKPGMYNYCDESGQAIDDIMESEEDILRLLSGGSITKTTLTL
jgi:hypothetical protein